MQLESLTNLDTVNLIQTPNTQSFYTQRHLHLDKPHSPTPVLPSLGKLSTDSYTTEYCHFKQAEQRAVAIESVKTGKTELRIRLADCKKDILAAQRLRYQLFSEEFGIRCGENGIDADGFDAYCHHLLVEDMASNRIVGTYRMLNAYGAKRCGKHYGQSEFTGALWRDMGDNLVELGRACIHPDYRSGTALMKLWQGIMDYLGVLSARYAIGYASVSLRDGGANALATQQYVDTQCRAWAGAALKPIKPFQLSALKVLEAKMSLEAGEPSALIKGYVRMGAFCIGAPAHDPVFNTADFPMLLDMTQLDKRYARHFKVDTTLTSLN